MFSLHGTKKLRDRAKQPVDAFVAEPSTWLGNWYGTVLFWRPQLALLVNERTLFPILMPLAPAATLLARFPGAVRATLEAQAVDAEFIESEVAAMADGRWAKTANRSVLGIMNEFTHLARVYRDGRGVADPVALALILAETPCGPLYKRHTSPDRELAAAVEDWRGAGAGPSGTG